MNRAFEKGGYLHVKDFLPQAVAELYFHLMLLRVARKKGVHDKQVPGAFAFGHKPSFEALLVQMRPKMEELTGLSLYPTYAYARLYRTGDELKRHVDRAACEISATVLVGYRGQPSALFFGRKKGAEPLIRGKYDDETIDREFLDGEPQRITLEHPGEAVIYKGRELIHWREPIEAKVLGQIFLHYVDKNGEHAEEKYDRRPSRYFEVQHLLEGRW